MRHYCLYHTNDLNEKKHRAAVKQTLLILAYRTKLQKGRTCANKIAPDQMTDREPDPEVVI